MSSAEARIAAWQVAYEELWERQTVLFRAMRECLQTRPDPPRELIIEVERKRDEVRRLFELAVDAPDAQSMTRTGHTNFGSLTP